MHCTTPGNLACFSLWDFTQHVRWKTKDAFLWDDPDI